MVRLDLICQNALSNAYRYRYVLVIVDFFSKLLVFVPLGNASAEAVPNAFVVYFLSKYGATGKIIRPCLFLIF